MSERPRSTEQPAFSQEVLAIYISSSLGEPVVPCESIIAAAGGGLEGDRYPARGFYSGKRILDEDRGISIISSLGIAESNKLLEDMGLEPYSWEETRRNLVVDIDPEKLNSLKNRQFMVGEVLVDGTDLCTPCVRPGELLGREIKAQQAFVKAFLRTGGLRVRVLKGGKIDIGSKLDFR